MLPESITLKDINNMSVDDLLDFIYVNRCMYEIIDLGFDVNKRYYDNDGTIFHYMGGYEAIWEELIKYCPDINVLDKFGNTILNFAMDLDIPIEFIQFLVKKV